MTLIDVKKGLLDRMKTVFPEDQYQYYSKDVVENYERPSFFTKLMCVDNSPMNRNSRRVQATFYVDYMQKNNDEADALKVVNALQELFGLSVKIGDRAVHVTGMDWNFVGNERNIPEMSFDLEWTCSINHNNKDWPLMESAKIKTKMEE